jgi:hypothetical protein
VGSIQRLFNGDIYKVKKSEDVNIITCFNKYTCYEGVPKHFEGQILTITDLDGDNECKIANLNFLDFEGVKSILRRNIGKDVFDTLYDSFKKTFPQITLGHCITCYKSQGSEFKNVFVNTKSFWYSFKDRPKKIVMLFKAFYTATTRASEDVTLLL